MNTIFGIDLGGTKIEGVVLADAYSTTPLARLRMPTEAYKGYDHIIQQIKNLIAGLESVTGQKAEKLGICTPGTFDPSTGLHKNSNTTALNGRPFKLDLSAALGLEIAMANDANCFALAEAKLGAAKGLCRPEECVVFGVIMGTGVGGGLVVNGKLIGGAQGITGEWGHNFLDESGGECYCGKIGCVETVISGPALERYYQSISGNYLTLKEIYQAHQDRSDEYASATIKRLVHYFGKSIAGLINIIDPDVIIIGGGVGNIDLLYTEGKAVIQDFIFNPTVNTRIVKPKLGDSAGVFGAAMLVA
jgi:predicted NBD/HSP70 family sugar kinase